MGRRLGQHFLSDVAILDRIVDAIAPSGNDVVVEIGPGQGTLTDRLVPRVSRVIAIEADVALADALRARSTGGARLDVIAGDALEIDWRAAAGTPAALKIIGNIPYYITSPLIEKALEPPLPAVIVFLVQKEFADRVAALPGSRAYGALSAGVQSVATVERLFTVRRGAFQPPPKVDSAVVRIIPREEPLVSVADHPAFRVFLAGLFSQRRKQLVRSLRDVLGAEKSSVQNLLSRVSIPAESRAEVLDPARLVELFRASRSLAVDPGDQ